MNLNYSPDQDISIAKNSKVVKMRGVELKINEFGEGEEIIFLKAFNKIRKNRAEVNQTLIKIKKNQKKKR